MTSAPTAAGPTYMPPYKPPEHARGDALDNAAIAKFNAGDNDAFVSDKYVRITVFLAAACSW